jgi:hypothetical protein
MLSPKKTIEMPLNDCKSFKGVLTAYFFVLPCGIAATAVGKALAL